MSSVDEPPDEPGNQPDIFVQGPSGVFPPSPSVSPGVRSLSPMVPGEGSPITSRDEAPAEVGQGSSSLNNLPLPSLLSGEPTSSDPVTVQDLLEASGRSPLTVEIGGTIPDPTRETAVEKTGPTIHSPKSAMSPRSPNTWPASPDDLGVVNAFPENDDPSGGEPSWVFLATSQWTFHLIRPYFASSWVSKATPKQQQDDLSDLALKNKTWLGTSYASLGLRQEFSRFRCRDLTLTAVVASYGFGTFFFPLVIYPTTHPAINQHWVVGPVLGLTFVLDAICHILMENTVKLSYLRQVCQFVVGLCALQITCGPSPWMAYYRDCTFVWDLFSMSGVSRPSVTSETVTWYCEQSMAPMPFVTLGSAFFILTLSPLIVIGQFCYGLLWFVLNRVLISHNPESVETIAVKATVLVVASSLFFVIYTLRYLSLMKQFEQAITAVREMGAAVKREDEVDDLLCQMIPAEALQRLSCGLRVLDFTEEATVLFSDMVHFTAWSSKRTPHQVVEMLNILCQKFDQESLIMGVEKVKTIGDAYWAVTGLPSPVDDHAGVMIEFANTMHDIVERANRKHKEWEGVRLRIGINSGSLSGGILGTQSISYEVFGHTSCMAEECEKNGVPNRVTISASTLEAANLLPEHAQRSKTMELNGTIHTLFVMKRESVEKMRTHSASQNQALSLGARHNSNKSPRASPRSLLALDSPRSLLTPQFNDEGSHRIETGSQRSFNVSLSHQASGESFSRAPIDEAKRRRQEFLAKRTAHRAGTGEVDPSSSCASLLPEDALDGGGNTALDEVLLRYSQRKYNWVLFRFADDAIELMYQEFAREFSEPLRKAARFFTLAVVVFLLVMVSVQASTFSAGSITCFTISIVCAVLDAIVYLIPPSKLPTTSDFHAKLVHASNTLSHFALFSCIMALGLMPQGEAIASNSILYVHAFLGSLEVVGNAGVLPSVVLSLLHVGLIFLPIMYFEWRTPMFTTGVIFGGLCLIVIIFLILVVEKKYRKQFLEKKVASHFVEEQAVKNREQEALLASIVPDHVVQDLTVWIALGMPLQQSIVKRFPHLVVAFVRLAPAVVPLLGGLPSPIDGPLVGPPSRESSRDMRLESAEHSSGSFVESHGKGDLNWMAPLHADVDGIIKRLPAIDKIKTIGDLVMLAGPFSDGHDSTETADQMLAGISQISAVASIQAGVHVGEIVGAVLGTNRLCFDIFGDTVNTSSRALSTGKPGEISVSEEWHSIYQRLDAVGLESPSERSESDTTERDDGANQLPGIVVADEPLTSPTNSSNYQISCAKHRYCGGAVFSKPIERQAKGKGSIYFRVVEKIPLVTMRELPRTSLGREQSGASVL